LNPRFGPAILTPWRPSPFPTLFLFCAGKGVAYPINRMTHYSHRYLAVITAVTIWFLSCSIRVNAQSTVTISLDSNDSGRVFEGVGAVSAGASSRLLFDYADPYRSDVLDYLFKPKYGAGFQHLKVEIGGGENSTCGDEPSHAITRGELSSPQARGYELWLMHEARQRNSKIILDCLPWSYPGWIHGAFSQDASDWLVAFLDVARTKYQMKIDWVAAGQNEVGTDRNWIVKSLRPTLDEHGYQEVQLQAPDIYDHPWEIFKQLSTDAAYSGVVKAVGYHYVSGREPWQINEPGYPSTPEAKAGSQSLWDSEEWSQSGETWDGPGAMYLACILNKMYIRDRVVKTELWCPLDSIAKGLPWADQVGTMQADSPWSGNYAVWPALWAVAHTTQFAQPGWHYLDGACRQFDPKTWKGSCVTLKDGASNNWSMIVCTDGPVSLNVSLKGDLNSGVVHVWSSNGTNQFHAESDLQPDQNKSFKIALQGDSIYSLTTTTGQQKGSATHAVPPASSFPFPYTEDFSGYQPGETPRYFTDQKGTFEVATAPDGKNCLKQVVPEQGILWFINSIALPYTVIGNQTWTNYMISADVQLAGGKVNIGGRWSDQSNLGYDLNLDKAGAWSLNYQKAVLASGQMADFKSGDWHVLKLVLTGKMIQGFIDQEKVAEVTDKKGRHGMAYLSSSYDANCFKNFSLKPVATLDKTEQTSQLARMGAKVISCDSEAPDYPAAQAIDGDEDTIWHTVWSPTPAPLPHFLIIDMGKTVQVKGLTYLARQDMANGRVGECEAYLSDDSSQWGQPVATAKLDDTDQLQTIMFETPASGRYLKFLVKTTFGNEPILAIAELDILGK
jgi:galactosylceramidase